MAENYFGITDTGRSRSNNEDSFIAETVNGRFIVACVIDGVGGYEGGEVAAQLARDAILSRLQKNITEVIPALRDALMLANESIHKEKQVSKKNAQMACVLTLALVDADNNKFYYAHVGDTRLYLLRDHSLVKISHDHSFVGFLEDNGRLSEEAAMQHPKRNEINKALGFDAVITAADYIETGESPFLPNDIILLCSDGLTDLVDSRTITSILNTSDDLSFKAKALINAANNAGGKDNITVVLVYNDKPAVEHTVTKPLAVPVEDTAAANTEHVIHLREAADEKVFIRPNGRVRKRSSAVPIFMFLAFLILAAILWIQYQNYKNSKAQPLQTIVVKRDRNPQEQSIVDSIGRAGTNEVFVLNQAGAPPVIITDTILINKDSLHVIGNGAVFKSDTTYKGPAFAISPSSRYVLLDSLTLQDFDIGVLARNRGLHLKNVHFRNCRVPVEYQFAFADTAVINGRFTDSFFYDSPRDSQ